MSLNDSSWQMPEAAVVEFLDKQHDYCLCIPVFNEGTRIKKELEHMNTLNITALVDILILDGGSTDGSTNRDFLNSQKVRTLLVNHGDGRLSSDYRMGFAYALRQGYKGIITIDGNNKDDPEGISRFIEALEADYDFVQGSRFISGGKAINTPWSRAIAIRLLHAPLISLGAGFWYTDTTNGFRAYNRRFLLDPRVQPFREVFYSYELLAYLSVRAPRTGYRVKEIPVTRAYPLGEEIPTKISGLKANLKLMTIILKAITGKYNP